MLYRLLKDFKHCETRGIAENALDVRGGRKRYKTGKAPVLSTEGGGESKGWDDGAF